MSDKPRIFATCPAGCMWETVHKSDFEASASHSRQAPNDAGEFILQTGRTYKIKKASLTELGFTINVRWSGTTQTGVSQKGIVPLDYLAVDVYEEYLTIRPLAFYNDELGEGLVTVVELDGNREVHTYLIDEYFTSLTSAFIVTGATECLLFNSDAQIVAEGRGIDRIEKGASGTGEDGRYFQEYIIYFTDGTTYSFEVKDGKDSTGGTGGGGDTTALENRIATLEKQMKELTYEEIAITSFNVSPSTAEIGSIVSNPVLSWKTNKTPSILILDGSALIASATSNTANGSYTQNKTWTLTAEDAEQTAATRTTTLSFLNGVYYGASAEPSALPYDSAFILGLTKTLRSSKLTSFNATAGEGQYIYYCIPSRFGTCEFTVGGFTGGFTLVDSIEFTNASGYTEEYYIYRSDNAALGTTTVTVK